MPTATQIIIALINWAIVIFFGVKTSKAAAAKGRKTSSAVLFTVLLALLGSFVCAILFLILGAENISTYFSPVFIALGSFAGLKLAERDK